MCEAEMRTARAGRGDGAVLLLAAGSLAGVFSELIERRPPPIEGAFVASLGPSGLLRERIEAGEPAHLFASADMAHPAALATAGRAAPPAGFAANRLCLLARPGLSLEANRALETMLESSLTLGVSTPGVDPSGDCALRLFARAETLRAGGEAALRAKARRLTGGRDRPTPPEGRSLHAWLLETGQADLFLTYRTNALEAAAQVAGLHWTELTGALAVETRFGLTVLDGAPEAAWRLAYAIEAKDGQALLARHGFAPCGRDPGDAS